MKTYEEVSAELTATMFAPMGRYEHHLKADSIPVLFKWMHTHTMDEVIVECQTNDQGEPTNVITIYKKGGLSERN